MPMPDPSDHTPDCPAQESGKPPAFVVQFDPSREANTVALHFWERCTLCGAVTAYDTGRLPWRSFHRTWRPTLATWLATWEHRHQLGDRVTGT